MFIDPVVSNQEAFRRPRWWATVADYDYDTIQYNAIYCIVPYYSRRRRRLWLEYNTIQYHVLYHVVL